MSNILYSVAYTQEGHLIKAVNAQKGQSYICPNCNRELILRRGKIKRPHFAHKTLSVNCTPETALHYIFKILLREKIQHHLESKLPLDIKWNCEYCPNPHTGNLLKKAVQVKLEHNLGVCKPDIALLDKDNKVIAVIEVVVSHSPEQSTLDYYERNKIALIQYILTTDEDISRLNNPLIEPDKVNFCRNPKCNDCGRYKSKKYLLIINACCWKCSELMKVAAIDGDDGYISTSDFSESDRELANEKGARVISQYSQTVGRTYFANTCRKCKAFIGDHYLFTDYIAASHYEEDVSKKEVFDVGYYCVRCI
ncbi:hypothetical protein H6F50_16530 [Coleofasciculus sp. FACHB-712]|uniref:competence protein CoiA family protein n=1 Tax=Cyanophyceae TaxID=3028117 RepID=UPI00168A012B|nr:MULTISPECIES: competence protein CoiA family protein [unclassified Coleofasciculus]MBD1900322.1 hypothetical protein [Coleofasciculus sp. FACHB-125]MBD1943947.1 hypothetical protein [Coleofasciculus sp. FACHB-712]